MARLKPKPLLDDKGRPILSPAEKAREKADWAQIRMLSHSYGKSKLFKTTKGKDAEKDPLELDVPPDTGAD